MVSPVCALQGFVMCSSSACPSGRVVRSPPTFSISLSPLVSLFVVSVFLGLVFTGIALVMSLLDKFQVSIKSRLTRGEDATAGVLFLCCTLHTFLLIVPNVGPWSIRSSRIHLLATRLRGTDIATLGAAVQ